MSAKGRAVVDPLEYYPTPGWAVRPVVPFVGPASSILDLGCGEGEIGAELREAFPRARITGVEIDTQRAAVARVRSHAAGDAVYHEVVTGDVIAPLLSPLPAEFTRAFDLVIANPPFSNAVAFLEQALRLVRFGGTVAFLLRATWIVPEERADVMTPDLLLLRRRPFPDATEYAWHTWRPHDPMHGGRFQILECGPRRRSLPAVAATVR